MRLLGPPFAARVASWLASRPNKKPLRDVSQARETFTRDFETESGRNRVIATPEQRPSFPVRTCAFVLQIYQALQCVSVNFLCLRNHLKPSTSKSDTKKPLTELLFTIRVSLNAVGPPHSAHPKGRDALSIMNSVKPTRWLCRPSWQATSQLGQLKAWPAWPTRAKSGLILPPVRLIDFTLRLRKPHTLDGRPIGKSRQWIARDSS